MNDKCVYRTAPGLLNIADHYVCPPSDNFYCKQALFFHISAIGVQITQKISLERLYGQKGPRICVRPLDRKHWAFGA